MRKDSTDRCGALGMALGPLLPVGTLPEQMARLLFSPDGALANYLHSLLGRSPSLWRDWDLEDFRQEVYARLATARALAGLDAGTASRAEAMLRRLARHVRVDQMRRSANRRPAHRSLGESGLRELPVHALESEPIDLLVSGETLELLRAAMSASEWNLLMMATEGLGWVEIARRTGSSSGAVRMRFGRLARRVARIVSGDSASPG